MPESVAAGPRSVTGDIVFPTVTTDRVLEQGDVIWVDSGVTLAGYDSDFGRTWIVGAEPTAAQRDQFRAWKDVVDAVLAATRPGRHRRPTSRGPRSTPTTAVGGRGCPHFYLAHGIGVDSAEAPFMGTDLGDDFDQTIVLAAGDGLRARTGLHGPTAPVATAAEEIVAVTEDGYQLLSDFHYEPYAA